MKKIVYISLLLFITNVYAEKPQLNFIRYSIKEGLPNNQILDIEQDTTGFVWIATTNGVCRYDGYTFKIYNTSHSNNIEETVIRNIFIDNNDKLWCSGDHIHKYDPSNDNFIKQPENIKKGSIINAEIDYKNNFWIYTDHFRRIAFYNRSTKKLLPVNKLLKKNIDHQKISNLRIHEDKRKLWIYIYAEKKAMLFDLELYYDTEQLSYKTINLDSLIKEKGPDSQFHLLYAIPEIKINVNGKIDLLNKLFDCLERNQVKSINTITIDQQERLWLGTGKGIYCYDAVQDTLYQYTLYFETMGRTTHLSIKYLFIDTFSQLWIATSRGLFRADLMASKIEHYHYIPNKENSLPDNEIHSIYVDRQGTIWCSTNAGLSAINQKTGKIKNYYDYAQGLEHIFIDQFIPCIAGYGDENLLIGNTGLQAINFDNKKYGYAHPDPDDPYSIPSWVVWKIHKGQKTGKWWIGCIDGFCELIPPEHGNIFETLKDVNNSGEQLYTLNYKFKTYLPDTNDPRSISCLNIWEIYETRDGKVYIGGENGLSIFHPAKGIFDNYYYDPYDTTSLSSNAVKCIYEDSKGRIWIGTQGGGINHFNKTDKTFTHLTTKDGLANNVVWGILEDKKGFLWFSTSDGLSKFNPEKITFTNYDASDGFQSSQFNRNAYFKDQKGKFYLGGVKGLNAFYPEDIKENPYLPTPVIIGFYLFNKQIKPKQVFKGDTILDKLITYTDQVYLGHHQNAVSIEFSGLQFANSNNIKYAYKLEGFDHQWINTDSHNKRAHYSNLPPGDYIFKVKTGNRFQQWNSKIATVEIIITPPFWQKFWFRALLVILVILVFFIIYRYRLHQIKRQNIRLENLVDERTCEIEQQKEELRKQAEQLQTYNKEITKANATKDKLFSIISHDLINPFHSILMASERLIKNHDHCKQKDMVKSLSYINKATEDIYTLLKNLLDWSRSQMEKIKYTPEVFDIRALFEEITDLFSFQLRTKNILLENFIMKSHQVYADKNMISTVLRNLLSNAIKFSEAGKKVVVNSYKRNKYIEIVIKDSGLGMTEEEISNIFSIEKHNSREGTSGEQGTGLGLLICKDFVEQNKGTMCAESEPGKGSTFFIQLQAAESSEVHQNKPTRQISSEQKPSSSSDEIKDVNLDNEVKGLLKDSIILVVEDNKTYINRIKEGLKDYCKEIVEAYNGKEGFNLALEVIPDLIVSDIMMPVMDGLELCNNLKSDKSTSHIPVILLTANDNEQNKVKGLQTGADDYLTKPFDPTMLNLRIANLIKNREQLKKHFSREIVLQPANISIPSSEENFINKIMERIEKNMGNPRYSIEALSKDMNMSYAQFYRKIESITGYAPLDFIQLIRFKKIAQILIKNKGAVSQTAYESGYNDPSYFAKAFKKQFGVTPSAYYKNLGFS